MKIGNRTPKIEIQYQNGINSRFTVHVSAMHQAGSAKSGALKNSKRSKDQKTPEDQEKNRRSKFREIAKEMGNPRIYIEIATVPAIRLLCFTFFCSFRLHSGVIYRNRYKHLIAPLKPQFTIYSFFLPLPNIISLYNSPYNSPFLYMPQYCNDAIISSSKS